MKFASYRLELHPYSGLLSFRGIAEGETAIEVRAALDRLASGRLLICALVVTDKEGRSFRPGDVWGGWVIEDARKAVLAVCGSGG